MTKIFELLQAEGRARRGRISLAHGTVETPIFMPVGTQGTVKGLTTDMVRACHAQIILGNTYHLALRPGDELIAELGGLHQFMNWQWPILTDSGGFQVFSLAKIRNISDKGVQFQSHIDGTILDLTPERAMHIQQNLGSDIAMVLDECPPADGTEAVIREAMARTVRWAERCRNYPQHPAQQVFAIVQGATNVDWRRACAEPLIEMDFPGYALGGFSVGEAPEEMHRVLPACADLLPTEKPRYLMGVGRPQDLLEGVAAGIDMFDCVMPTRNGRNASGFTADGPIRMKNACHRRDPRPIESDCDCYTCEHYSRGYLHHLFQADEMLGPTLLSIHNIRYYLRLMEQCRTAIEGQVFDKFYRECLARWSDAS
ncbi:MAG: tRNA guanosine(34) transglycosylase Tgt [Zavarzinella sp.]